MNIKKKAPCLERRYRFKFDSYGVKIAVGSNSGEFLQKIKDHLPSIFPNCFVLHSRLKPKHDFLITVNNDRLYELYKDGELMTSGDSEENMFKFFCSRLRLTVAEFAVSRVFLHAGVVGWKGKAIVFPAQSFQGKSTLVAELIKRGALYLSDEYAVLDENGLVHPFPKTLSLREMVDKYEQTEYSATSLGGKTSSAPLPVGMVLITQFEPGAKWEPEILSEGRAILEIVPHTIPIRHDPEFSLRVLNKIVNRAIIAKSKRSEAKGFIDLLFELYETNVK